MDGVDEVRVRRRLPLIGVLFGALSVRPVHDLLHLGVAVRIHANGHVVYRRGPTRAQVPAFPPGGALGGRGVRQRN